MQILVVGFQGSGVTILRRLLSIHPGIAGAYEDKFLMHRCDNAKDVDEYVKRRVRTFEQNWVEAISYYNEFNIVDYCKKWSSVFGKTSRIIHLIRHPIDVAMTLAKREQDSDFYADVLEVYKEKMGIILPKMSHVPNVMNIKYEDLLLNPDETLPELYSFCQMDRDIDFRAALLSKNKPKFINTLDTSGVFAHKYKSKVFTPVKMDSVIQIINSKVDGEEY